MTYTLAQHESHRYAHAVVFGNSDKRIVFVGAVFPLTQKRKRAIVAALIDAWGLPQLSDSIDGANVFNRNAFMVHNDVTLTNETLTNDDDASDVRHYVADNHSHGGGTTLADNHYLVTL